MQEQKIALITEMFSNRLDTLGHLLGIAEAEFKEGEIFQKRIAPDMFPFGTQIAFTCNQPRAFSLWCHGSTVENLGPDVTTFVKARDHIAHTKELLKSIDVPDSKLDEIKRIELGHHLYAELPGHAYVQDFLIPNFYFHLTTAYDVLRMAGAKIGKRDFMLHLAPQVKQNVST